MTINAIYEKLKSILLYAEKDYYTDDWWKKNEWWDDVHEFYRGNQLAFNKCLFEEIKMVIRKLNHIRINALLLLIQGTYYFNKQEEEKLAVLFYRVRFKTSLLDAL